MGESRERGPLIAVEYATVTARRLYTVILWGPEKTVAGADAAVSKTLVISEASGRSSAAPIDGAAHAAVPPLTPPASSPKPPPAIEGVARGTMAVVAIERIGARGGGATRSETGADGPSASQPELWFPAATGTGAALAADDLGGDAAAGPVIATALHLLEDPATGRLRELFAIGRTPALGSPAFFMCAGRTANAVFIDRARDLVGLRCEVDLVGKPWPATAATIAPLPIAGAVRWTPGAAVWVVGYPKSAGGAAAATSGRVLGWTGPDGAPGRDYAAVAGAVEAGQSGAPVVDATGALVGIAAGYRLRAHIETSGDAGGGDPRIHTERIGLVRDIDQLRRVSATASSPRADDRQPRVVAPE